ncbi:hypothetical protein OG871_39995 (plasmid) [Kitasatospora sp. NBC_00374]|uniref:hypothetical protein n=1 Tax=Kitasatospora sp. NBC_00374 TaxID=2975964 RepID=UPI002F9171B3
MTAEAVWTTLFWTGLPVLAAVGTAAWWMTQYPGTWRHAFDPRHRQDREHLRTARHNLRQAEQQIAAEQDRARSAADTAARDHQNRIRQAEQHLAALRAPSTGPLLHSLGERLDLYEQVLRVNTDLSTGTDYPLLGLEVDDRYSLTDAFLYVTPPRGRRELVTLPLTNIPEADVRAFAVHVHNAIADAGPASERRRALIPAAEAELKHAIADTTGRGRAERNLRQVTDRANNDLRIPRARRDLEAAHDRWHELTGHRPT